MRKITKKILSEHNRKYLFAGVFAVLGIAVLIAAQAASITASLEPELGSLGGCAKTIASSSASETTAVRFNSTENCSVLDESGKTIPKTNYAIPTGAIYISPAGADKTSSSVDGNDANDGATPATPVKTINRAIALVSSTRSTIVMRGGEYRDWNYNSAGTAIQYQSKSINFQAYPGESPWFNGSDVVSDGWTSDGAGHWRRSWNTPSFCGGGYYTAVNGLPPFSPNLTVNTPCVYWDAVKGNPNVAGDPQMVFINDEKYAQTPALASVTGTSKTFYYDWANKTMYIGVNPSGNKVELATRPQALMLNQGSYAIKGVGFKRYATGAFPEGATFTSASVVYVNVPSSLTIENAVFVDNAGGTLSLSQPKNNSAIRSTVIANNGSTGLGVNGSRTSGGRDDFVVENSILNANNQENFDLQCSGACGASNAKFANMVGFTVKNSIFENGVGRATGFWCDVNCTEGVMVNNLVRNNGGRGIFYEISNKGIIASNVVAYNGSRAISVASANTKVYNNTVIVDRANSSDAIAFDIFDDDRCTTCQNDSGIGPDTTNVELVNNIAVAIGDLPLSYSIYGPVVGTNTKASQFYSKFDYNAYHRTAASNRMYTWKYDNGTIDFAIKSSAAFTTATGWDGHALDISSASVPFFMDLASGDYRLKTDSQPYINKGLALPADVAAALGLQTGAVIPRGAVSWPK